MSFEELLRLVEQVRARYPRWFELEQDPPATEKELTAAEERLCVRLPECYRTFVTTFGGGYFAFANVFSVKPGSDWNIADRNLSLKIPSFVAVSDSGTGDLFGFKVIGGVCEESVFDWDHETAAVLPIASFTNLYDFLARTALTSSSSK